MIETTNPRKQALSNQSLVYRAFGESEKLTIAEVEERLEMSDRTVRRAIKALVVSGHLKTYGMQNNARLYGRISAAYADSKDKLVNFGGELVSIEDFVKAMVSPEEKPLQKGKTSFVSIEMEHHIRRRMAYVVITAGNAGLLEQLKKVNRELHGVLDNLKHIENILQNFMDSPIWFQQYRDELAFSLRRLQENEPDLFSLAQDYVKGG